MTDDHLAHNSSVLRELEFGVVSIAEAVLPPLAIARRRSPWGRRISLFILAAAIGCLLRVITRRRSVA